MQLDAVVEYETGPYSDRVASGRTPRNATDEGHSLPLATLPASRPVFGAPVAVSEGDALCMTNSAKRIRRREADGQPSSSASSQLWPGQPDVHPPSATIVQVQQHIVVGVGDSRMHALEHHASAALLAAQARMQIVVSEANAHALHADLAEAQACDAADRVVADANNA